MITRRRVLIAVAVLAIGPPLAHWLWPKSRSVSVDGLVFTATEQAWKGTLTISLDEDYDQPVAFCTGAHISVRAGDKAWFPDGAECNFDPRLDKPAMMGLRSFTILGREEWLSFPYTPHWGGSVWIEANTFVDPKVEDFFRRSREVRIWGGTAVIR